MTTNIRSTEQVACDGVRTAWRVSAPRFVTTPMTALASMDGVLRVRRVSSVGAPARQRVIPGLSAAVVERMRQTMDGIHVPRLRYRV